MGGTGNCSQTNQCQARSRIVLAVQMPGGFDDHHLERWADMALQQVSTVRGPVRFANDHVNVQRGNAVLESRGRHGCC
jgi:hypothetical protein